MSVGRGRGILLATLMATVPAGAGAQDRGEISVRNVRGDVGRIAVVSHEGYAAFSADDIHILGWGLQEGQDGTELALPEAVRVRLTPGIPFLHWNDRVVQLAQAPYVLRQRLYIPVQLLIDLLPAFLPERYDYDRKSRTLTLVEPEDSMPPPPVPLSPAAETQPGPAGSGLATGAGELLEPRPTGSRVVVIDAGHGGIDPGTAGRSGLREKDVALATAQALARELARDPVYAVYLTRSDDRLIPIWQRGELATGWKGDRSGVFVSIHVNSVPSGDARGFETYFLAEARTEHERRMAAIENEPVSQFGQEGAPSRDLSLILNELRTLDHQHWSALLAEIIQGQMAEFHPGPNRGVKQAPLAVLTNPLMPAVLVELGYITDRREEALMGQPAFQRDAARALARSIDTFFDRYPPGASGASGAPGAPGDERPTRGRR